MIEGILIIFSFATGLFCLIFLPGLKAYNTTISPNVEKNLILSDNGGINKSRNMNVRLVTLFILAIGGLTSIIIAWIVRMNCNHGRYCDCEGAMIATRVGGWVIFVTALFITYNFMQKKRVRSSIYIHDTYVTGQASWGVTYKLSYDQITSVELLKEERVLVLYATGRHYRVWVTRNRASRIHSLILEQREKVNRESSAVVVQSTCICGYEFIEGAKFCMNCGSPPVVVVHPICSCGYVFAEGAKFCINCGSAPPQEAEAMVENDEAESEAPFTCSCGYVYKEGAKFCKECGSSLVTQV
jgi:hypothetical protein